MLHDLAALIPWCYKSGESCPFGQVGSCPREQPGQEVATDQGRGPEGGPCLQRTPHHPSAQTRRWYRAGPPLSFCLIYLGASSACPWKPLGLGVGGMQWELCQAADMPCDGLLESHWEPVSHQPLGRLQPTLPRSGGPKEPAGGSVDTKGVSRCHSASQSVRRSSNYYYFLLLGLGGSFHANRKS